MKLPFNKSGVLSVVLALSAELALAKEISFEDVKLVLQKLPDRLYEHPATVFVLTNMAYAEAPWLSPKSPAAASSLVWREVALTGSASAEFETQIAELQPFLEENWRAHERSD